MLDLISNRIKEVIILILGIIVVVLALYSYAVTSTKNAINNDIIGFYIEAGKRSNIIIIDYDNKPTTNPDFFGKLQALETLTIKHHRGVFILFLNIPISIKRIQ